MNKLYRYIALATLLFTGCSEYTADVEYVYNIDERIISFVSFNEIHPSAPNCVSVIWDSETGDGAIGFDEAITTIPYGIFTGAQGLTSVWLPDGTISINDNAFASCENLKTITIPNSVTTIGNAAFKYCSSLKSVTIGNSVTKIGSYAFWNCSSLTSVYCRATTPPAGVHNMFKGNVSNRKIYVPMESVEAYKSAKGWSNYSSYIVGYAF